MAKQTKPKSTEGSASKNKTAAPGEKPVAKGESGAAKTKIADGNLNLPPRNTADAGATANNSQVQFNTSQLKSSYCNVCNATSTREEVVLNFGLNESWDLGNSDIQVALHHRVILSPQAAKRLQELLNRILSEHEARYGAI